VCISRTCISASWTNKQANNYQSLKAVGKVLPPSENLSGNGNGGGNVNVNGNENGHDLRKTPARVSIPM